MPSAEVKTETPKAESRPATCKARRPLADALRDAEAFRGLFDGCYERWEIAGSVRRRKPDVGDVEHVVIPRFVRNPETMFDDQLVSAVRLRAKQLLAADVVSLHGYGGSRRFGSKYLGVHFCGFLHEVFSADADNWGCILAIRTGPAEFSRRLMVALRIHRHFMHRGRLRRVDGLAGILDTGLIKTFSDDGIANHSVGISCPDEATFFAAAGFDKVTPPEERQ